MKVKYVCTLDGCLHERVVEYDPTGERPASPIRGHRHRIDGETVEYPMEMTARSWSRVYFGPHNWKGE